MKILSLFDGMSCGHLALDRAGISVSKYYASEIDKYAMTVTMKNYPDTIQLGSITEWQNWNVEKPDMIIGGSPCQGFSFAGKQLNFEDERSKLFFVFVDILKHYKPKYFLLENVIMKKEHNDVISRILGELYPECTQQQELFQEPRLEPIQINSALVSAQNRNRLYWTNIQGITQPKDKGILLKDIVEINPDKKFEFSKQAIQGLIKHKERHKKAGNGHGFMEIRPEGKSNTIRARSYKDGNENIIILASNNKPIEIPPDAETPFMLMEIRTEEGKESRKKIRQEEGRDSTKRSENCKKYIPNKHQKSNTVMTANGDMLSQIFITDNIPGFENNKSDWRKLTPRECERLQTVPDNYTNHVSNSQRYKMLGNGWTVDVIVHIFSFLKKI